MKIRIWSFEEFMNDPDRVMSEMFEDGERGCKSS